jgi:CTP:molybdopterin cytidylyltransferase MocA
VGAVTVIIFHPAAPAAAGPAAPWTALLNRARDRLIDHQVDLFRGAGAAAIDVVRTRGSSFGAALVERAREVAGDRSRRVRARAGQENGLVVLGAGAVPLLRAADARRLVAVAASGLARALTNNRYSSDVCAVGQAAVLEHLPALAVDNTLPRWLADHGRVVVEELPDRQRLALDLDTPLDLALLALAPGVPASLHQLRDLERLDVPRLAELQAVLGDPTRELLVFGRASARTLAVLERRAACRVRFLAEERGLRASVALAHPIRRTTRPWATGGRGPHATLGRLIEMRGGPEALVSTVAELADGALLDSRVLLADRLGADERSWPVAEDRYASDLLRPATIGDRWLHDLTAAAAAAPMPILLGGHTLVGPGVRLLLRPSAEAAPPA